MINGAWALEARCKKELGIARWKAHAICRVRGKSPFLGYVQSLVCFCGETIEGKMLERNTGFNLEKAGSGRRFLLSAYVVIFGEEAAQGIRFCPGRE